MSGRGMVVPTWAWKQRALIGSSLIPQNSRRPSRGVRASCRVPVHEHARDERDPLRHEAADTVRGDTRGGQRARVSGAGADRRHLRADRPTAPSSTRSAKRASTCKKSRPPAKRAVERSGTPSATPIYVTGPPLQAPWEKTLLSTATWPPVRAFARVSALRSTDPEVDRGGQAALRLVGGGRDRLRDLIGGEQDGTNRLARQGHLGRTHGGGRFELVAARQRVPCVTRRQMPG